MRETHHVLSGRSYVWFNSRSLILLLLTKWSTASCNSSNKSKHLKDVPRHWWNLRVNKLETTTLTASTTRPDTNTLYWQICAFLPSRMIGFWGCKFMSILIALLTCSQRLQISSCTSASWLAASLYSNGIATGRFSVATKGSKWWLVWLEISSNSASLSLSLPLSSFSLSALLFMVVMMKRKIVSRFLGWPISCYYAIINRSSVCHWLRPLIGLALNNSLIVLYQVPGRAYSTGTMV